MSAMFDLMAVYSDFWRMVKWSKPTALFGMDAQEVATPVPVEINMNRLHERFLKGLYLFEWLREDFFFRYVGKVSDNAGDIST